MHTTVFYLAGLRLSTVFYTLIQAGVQSSKSKAAFFVLLSYMQLHLQSSEVIMSFKGVNFNKELGPIYLGVWYSQNLYTVFSVSIDSKAAVISIHLKLAFHMAVDFSKM